MMAGVDSNCGTCDVWNVRTLPASRASRIGSVPRRITHHPRDGVAGGHEGQPDAERWLTFLPHLRDPVTIERQGRRRTGRSWLVFLCRPPHPAGDNRRDEGNQHEERRRRARTRVVTCSGRPGFAAGSMRADGIRQPGDIVVESLVAHLERVPIAESGQRGRKLFGRRHAGAADENRDDRDVAAKGGGNLVLHEIVGALGSFLQTLEPSRPDDDEDAVARGDRLVDRLREVLPGGNVLQVHEDARVAKAGRQAIAQTPGVAAGVFASIADEDARHRADI